MTEETPKLIAQQENTTEKITQRDVFRALRKNMAVYVSLGSKCPSDIREGANNAATAFNLIFERIDNREEIPSSWPEMNFPADAPLILVKQIDGQVWQQKITCDNPAMLILKMKKFHGLAALISEEEKAAKAAAEKKEAEFSSPEGIRALRLAREAANEAKVTSATPTVTPRRPSVFRPKG